MSYPYDGPPAAPRSGGTGPGPRTEVIGRSYPPGGVYTGRPPGGVYGSPPPPSVPPPASGGGSGGSDGPRDGDQRRRPWRARILTAIAICSLLPFVLFVIAYVWVDVPKPGDIPTNQVATITAIDGSTVISKVVPPEGNRTDVTIEQVPVPVRHAVLAAEDRNFYSNPGFSVTGFGRALRDNLLGKDTAGGGSTITQQYVKNALVGSERTLSRKMHELVISSKMAREWSKDDILAAYLNTIYFGRGAYGISAAAKAYFNKPVEQLTVAEGAVLAAVVQQPTRLDPETNPTGAQTRWNYVLDGMVEQGWLTPTERANTQFPLVVPMASLVDPNQDSGPEGLIKARVLQELSDIGISEKQLNTEGLKIVTTIDAKAQDAAVAAVDNNMQGEPPELRTAVVSIDPRTGGVKAYYGGRDGKGYDFANAGLQTGSSFKVFGLAANLADGTPLSKMYDSSPLTVNGIQISNVEGESCGTCTIAEALKRSLNTSFYRMMMQMGDGTNGPQLIADMAHKLGIPVDIPGVGPSLTEPGGAGPNYGIVLGQYQSRPIDMASAYATLAASGMYHPPHFVQQVTSADGVVLFDRAPTPGEQRVDKAVADNVTSAMRPIAGYSRGHNLAGGRGSAAKTGTSQLGDTGENKDAWMVGYTPSLATAVWVGTEQGLPLRNVYGGPIYGSGLPSDIWKATMDGALDGTDNEPFPDPEPIAGQAGVPEYTAPYVPPRQTQAPVQTQQQAPAIQLPQLPQQPPVVITPSQIEILPGVTIPVPGVAPAEQQIEPQTGQPVEPAVTQPEPPAGTGQPSNGQAPNGQAPSIPGRDQEPSVPVDGEIAGAEPTVLSPGVVTAPAGRDPPTRQPAGLVPLG
ncbi:transglycosylase domain-containing protein [Skermania piniformis]